MNFPEIKNVKSLYQAATIHNPQSVNDFDGLLRATKGDGVFDTVIQGNKVRLIPNPFSDAGLFSLFINERQSNSCRRNSMRKLIREWQNGERYVNGDLLMKKY